MTAFDAFAPFGPSARPVLREVLAGHPEPLSWYSYTTLRLWHDVFHYRWRRLGDGTVLVATAPESEHGHHLLQPIGPFAADSRAAVLELADALPYPLRLYGVSDAFLREHGEWVAHFTVHLDRDMSEYLYRASDLAELPGRRYSYKRSLAARARQAATLTIEPLGAANLEACAEVLRRHDETTALPDANDWLAREGAARATAFCHFDELNLEGILIRADGEPAAFSVFEVQKGAVGVVHFERARREIPGLYQMVNQEAARVLVSRGCTLVNRQDDAGLPGLRQAKRSYHPSAMIDCYVLEYRGAPH